MDKITARKEYLALRSSMSEELRMNESDRISARVMDFLKDREFEGILSYASYKSEVDSWKFNLEILKAGYKLYLPRTTLKDIQFYGIDNVSTDSAFRRKLVKNKLGIMEPMPDTVKKFKPKAGKKYIAFVPGVAFDKDMHRMGYGKAYYDRFFSDMEDKSNIIKVGICYCMCLFPEIPYDNNDISMDYVLTGDKLYE